jgi:predicted dienelactone hydrolase
MPARVRHCIIWLSGLLAAARLLAAQVGWMEIHVPGATRDAPATTVALYYPTQDTARAMPMGPFTVNAALYGKPEATVRGLIMISHGTGGSELGHSRLAEALAGHGYLVAALRHPGDNWQDNSLLTQHRERYFFVRPGQVSRVVDALLLDPKWKDRIARDERGPRIGAIGHSAGGYTVLALAGGEPDMARLARHCAEECAEDPLFCSTGRSQGPAPATAPPADRTPLRDPRVRAVAALAPVSVLFSAASLASIKVPTAIYEAQSDRWLVPRFHAEWAARNIPGVQLHRVPNAWHFAFMDTPTTPLQTLDGDIAADPPGFDRAAFLARLGGELNTFFDQAWQAPGDR